MKRFFLSVSLALLLLSPAAGKKYAWEYDLKKLNKEANNGDIWSQYWLAKTYDEGRLGVAPNQAQAFDWYLKAARQGNSAAQLEVAKRYLNGKGTTSNEKEFIYWLQKCAENPAKDEYTFDARVNVGKFMGFGEHGFTKDPEKGIQMVNRAELGYMDFSDKANYMYFKKKYILGFLNLEKANASFSPEDYLATEKAFEQAVKELDRHWIESARSEYQDALLKIAYSRLMYNTFADKNDYKVMIDALDKASRWGSSGAKYVLGEAYYFGEFGLPKDTSKGWSLWSECYKVHSKAAYQMAEAYYNHRNYESALKFFQNFVDTDYPDYPASDAAKSDAYRKLSTMYRHGRGVAANEKKADEYLSKAVALGDADAAEIKKWLGGM